eukprot:gnl/TRDRNA2_/TRDRNA2_49837_c0_seq1.p1 gnl/TRDRNA2_/TRDRNA2_49837_c0~~gnl/TRDRNA2_/TRDRNA2_49837_c0_seq1.p1  ORF type:complete len:262 (+),score=47.64 gnl/TRDRNA2_/TRDRNA2_49837_c0_seq1:229-1014(+)
MQQIVLLLLAGGDSAKVRDPMKMSPWIEKVCSTKSVEEWNAWSPNGEEQVVRPTRRVIKTHAPVHLAPWTGGAPDGIRDGAKVIVVVRNPKDAAVSLFHHARDLETIFQYSGDWAHFVSKLFIPGKVESGCFWAWHAGWWRVHGQAKDSVLWISYESLKADLTAGIARVAEFCGIEADDVLISAVARASTFDAMRQQFAEVDAKKFAAGQFVKKNHIRQGKSGSWRDTFTEEQLCEFDTHHAFRSDDLGLPQDLFDFGVIE